MRTGKLAGAGWCKSSRSNGESDQSNCVEVAELADRIALRDSKDPAGPVLSFPPHEWRVFLGRVRTGQFG
ncbi:MAG: DUF397 domain-containing protein [Pseudonocardiaceae bacterium]